MNPDLAHANLFDIAIALAFTASIFSACHRGVAKEVLHTFLFGLAAVAGFFFFLNKQVPADKDALVGLLINLGYYLLTVYLLTWAALRFGAPLFLDGHAHLTFRSRFWAGIITMAKLLTVCLALNLWYAVKSPDPHPQRLEALPMILRHSALIFLSDEVTEKIYKDLASMGYLEYSKYIERPDTLEEQQGREVERLLGIPQDPSPSAGN